MTSNVFVMLTKKANKEQKCELSVQLSKLNFAVTGLGAPGC